MQKTVQYLYLYFTKNDQDLLAWANMIKENNLGLSTWIQAILVSEAAKEKLDIGSVHVPSVLEPVKTTAAPSLWGDDTDKESKIVPGWHVRGENKKLIAGTVLPVKITRHLAQEALFELKKRHKKIAAYIKAIIRQNLKILPSGPNIPPNKNTAIDLFALCEGKIGRNNQPRRDKNQQLGQRQENNTDQAPQPPKQKQGRQDKNTPQQTYPSNPQPKPNQSKQTESKAPARRNPLLDQIS